MNPDSAKNEIATDGARGGEPRVAEQAHVEHRLLGAPLAATNAAASTAVSAKLPSVRALLQPWFGASMIV